MREAVDDGGDQLGWRVGSFAYFSGGGHVWKVGTCEERLYFFGEQKSSRIFASNCLFQASAPMKT